MSNKVATDEWYKGSVQEEWILQVKSKYKSQIDILETKNNTRVYLLCYLNRFLICRMFFRIILHIPVEQIHI